MTALSLQFPQSLTEKYRPPSPAEFIGIPEAKAQAESIIRRPIPNSAFLFAGESGTGKTCMILAIAKALEAQLHHIPARQASKEAIEKIWDAVHYAPWAGRRFHVVGMDEIDLWRADLQDMMLSLWDSMGSLTNTLFGDWTPNPPQVIWVGTTNVDHRKLRSDSRFEPRFLSRCRIVPFSSYGMNGALAEFLAEVWKREGGNGNTPDFVRMAKEQRNNVRACLNELEGLLAVQ